MNLTSVDPFRKNITIASLCHFIFRNFLLDPDEIALIPDNGYNRNQITSQAAESWLKFLIYSRKIQIKHAKNGGEKIFEGMSSNVGTLLQWLRYGTVSASIIG